jgi:hypothetical protein
MKTRTALVVIVLLTLALNMAPVPVNAQLNISGSPPLPVAYGGTGAATLTGIVTGNGTNALTATTTPALASGTTVGSGGGTAALNLSGRGFIGYSSGTGNVSLQGILGKGVELCVGDVFASGTCFGIMSSAGAWKWSAYGAGALTTDSSGNITATSDERLKYVQGPYLVGLSEVNRLRTIIYKWRPESHMETEHEYAGFGARQVQSVMPLATGINKDGHLTLQDRAILAALVNSVQELSLEIDKLKKNIVR